jgi:hypothetical protein
MKNKTVETTVEKNRVTPEILMGNLLRDNKEGGTIFLSDFMAQLPGNTDKSDVIQALRGNKEGVFIPGRHGHPSRWVYGPMRNEIPQAERNEAVAVTEERSGERRGRKPKNKDMVEITISVGGRSASVFFNKMDLLSEVMAA